MLENTVSQFGLSAYSNTGDFSPQHPSRKQETGPEIRDIP